MRKIITMLYFLSMCCTLSAQSKAEAALQAYYKKHPVEKIFIQYNNESYMAGESMRLKCYVFLGYLPTNLSTNLYLELYNQEKELLDKLMIPLLNGIGEGGFELNGQLPEGVYYIRAYTTWMLNFDENFPYLHSFLIYNPQSDRQIKAKPVSWVAQAFAESGQLLAGIENKLTVRLFTETFLPESWQGVIKEKLDSTKEIVRFSSINQEVASFQFVPEANKIYIATITDNTGRTRSISLPNVRSSGVLLKAKQAGDTIICKLLFRGLQAKGQKYILLGQMQHELMYKTTIEIRDSIVNVKLPITGLTNGILHLTLFNDKEQPLAERLVFVHTDSRASTHIQFDTLSFAPRAINSLLLNVDSVSLNSYTVMVSDVSMPVAKENLLSSLWLSNAIIYKPYHPAWYFNDQNLFHKEALDALLVSEKWRWFSWKNIMEGRFPNLAYQSDYYLSYTGTVFRFKKLQLNKPVNLIFNFSDSSTAFGQFHTDSSGSFQIDGVLFTDTAKVFFMLNSKKYSAKDIHIIFEKNNKFKKLLGSMPKSSYALFRRQPLDTLSPTINRRMQVLNNQFLVERRYKSLEEVVVRAKKLSAKEQLNKRLSSTIFRSFDEVVFDFENENHSIPLGSDILSWVRARVSGFSFTEYNNIPVSVYVDEVLANAGAEMPPASEIAMIKVFRNSTAGIHNGKVIAIYTRRGDGGSSRGMPQVTLAGYKVQKPVLRFDYSDELFGIIEEDKRELLCWETTLHHKDGRSSIRFYNNDVSKAFRVIVTGFTKDGQPVYWEKVVSSDRDVVH